MKFWDSSALVPLLVEEPTTASLLELAAADPEILTWWGSQVECASAIARLERAGGLEAAATSAAFARLGALAGSWYEIEPGDTVRETAKRMLRVHDLRAADALQLAAAAIAAELRPASLQVVCLDGRLGRAANREGFQVIDQEAL